MDNDAPIFLFHIYSSQDICQDWKTERSRVTVCVIYEFVANIFIIEPLRYLSRKLHG
jgi:hypothetical protein